MRANHQRSRRLRVGVESGDDPTQRVRDAVVQDGERLAVCGGDQDGFVVRVEEGWEVGLEDREGRGRRVGEGGLAVEFAFFSREGKEREKRSQ